MFAESIASKNVLEEKITNLQSALKKSIERISELEKTIHQTQTQSKVEPVSVVINEPGLIFGPEIIELKCETIDPPTPAPAQQQETPVKTSKSRRAVGRSRTRKKKITA